MERKDREPRSGERLQERVDLSLARQEDEHVARVARGDVDGLAHAGHEALGIGEGVALREEANVHGEGAAFRGEERAVHMAGDALGLDRGRHDDEVRPGIRPASAAQEEGEQEVHVEAPLVELVEHHGGEALEERCVAKHDSRRREHDPSARFHDRLVADDVPDGLTQSRPLELGDPGREAPARDPPRLHDQRPPGAPSRQLRRLP